MAMAAIIKIKGHIIIASPPRIIPAMALPEPVRAPLLFLILTSPIIPRIMAGRAGRHKNDKMPQIMLHRADLLVWASLGVSAPEHPHPHGFCTGVWSVIFYPFW
jgi:hypothetical protein